MKATTMKKLDLHNYWLHRNQIISTRWIGYVSHMRRTKTAENTLAGISECKTVFSRPRRKLDKTIKTKVINVV
jgi:hypothetical protein